MTEKNIKSDTEDDVDDEAEQNLKTRLKAYLFAAYATVAAAISQSAEEIAPQLRGLSLPQVSGRALKSLVLAGLLIGAAVAMPAAPFASDGPQTEPVEGETFEPVDDGPSLNGVSLNTLPSTYLGSGAEAPDPPKEVRASAGSQTMAVETAVVDGEPAIVLDDERTPDGRWVSIETSWLNEHVGEVPEVAYVDHESGNEYAAPLQVRGESAAFYVREFSTNTVTFDGEVRLSGAGAGDGTEYQYELGSTEDVDDPSINLTGLSNTQTVSDSGTGAASNSVSGNQPTEAQISVDFDDNETSTVNGGTSTSNYGIGTWEFDEFNLPDRDVITKVEIDTLNTSQSYDLRFYIDGRKFGGTQTYTKSPTFTGEMDNPNPGGSVTAELRAIDAYGEDDLGYVNKTDVKVTGETTFDSGDSGATLSSGSSSVSLDSNSNSKTITLDPSDGYSVSQDADAPFTWELDYTAETVTTDPVVELNGETVGVDGTLADGETVSLSQNASALQEGTNRVNVSTNSPSSGPASLVGLEYSHGAETTTSATVEETTWSQTTNVSNTWPSARSNATATLPMNDRVVDVRNVEVRENGTTWEPVAESDYTLNGTDLTIELGDVAEGSTTEVRATGSKVRVEDGAITVLDPTTSSDTLDTRVRVDDAGPDFALSVDETIFGDRVHYAENATWGETTGEATITADGGKTLTLPDATAGAETSVRTWPIAVAPTAGEVTVTGREGDRSEPGIAVAGDGNSEVEYTFVDATDNTPYVLYSTTNGIVRDSGMASSPITLVDDNSEETLVFQLDDGVASGSGSGSSAGGGGPGLMPAGSGGGGFTALQALIPDASMLLLGLGGLATGLVAVRRSGLVDEGTRGAAAVDTGQDVATTAGRLVERVLENEIVLGLVLLAGGGWLLTSGVLPEQTTLIVSLSAVPVAMFLVLQQFDRFDIRIWAGSTALVGVLGLQILAPELGETIAEEAGVIIVVGALLLGWRALSAWRAEASTPDEVTRLEINAEENDDG